MKTVVYHSADYDGIFCREIARKFLGDEDVSYLGWNFGDKPLQIPNNRLYVMDLPLDKVFGFSYTPSDKIRPGPQHPPGLIWIDHHKTSIETHPVSIQGVRIDGVAACRLAWQWFTHESGQGADSEGKPWTKEDYVERRVREPLAVRLAGEYDIWDKRDPRAETFQYALRTREQIDWGFLLQNTYQDFNQSGCGNGRNYFDELLHDGKVAQSYAQQMDASICKYKTWLMPWEGLTFLCVNSARFNSLLFASKDTLETGHDALLGFCFDGRTWTVSLYHAQHRTDLDLSTIAKKYGGGGHRGACGFTTKTLPFSL